MMENRIIFFFIDCNLKIEKEKTDKEIYNTISLFFSDFKIDSDKIKKYVVDAIEMIYLKNGLFRSDEIIMQANVSMRQFQRDFKKITGFSPKEFSSIVRINSLSSELIKENVSLRDIFFNFGFYDQAHFNKEFKKLVGASPSAFESRQKLIKYLNLLK